MSISVDAIPSVVPRVKDINQVRVRFSSAVSSRQLEKISARRVRLFSIDLRKMPVAPGTNSYFCNYTDEMQDGRADS
jgi:hypothetical protein